MYVFSISYVIIWSRILFVGYSMKKEKAEFQLLSNTEEIKEKITLETKENSIYYFSLKDNSNNRFSREELLFTRETNEMLLDLDFKTEKNSKIYLKQEKLEYSLNLQVIQAKIEKKKIEIKYELNGTKYLFKIILEGE